MLRDGLNLYGVCLFHTFPTSSNVVPHTGNLDRQHDKLTVLVHHQANRYQGHRSDHRN